MATKVVVCPECESPLVRGRFACSSCGAVVASVASDARSLARAEPMVPPIVEAAPIVEPSKTGQEPDVLVWEEALPEPEEALPEPEEPDFESEEPLLEPDHSAWKPQAPVYAAALPDAGPAAVPAVASVAAAPPATTWPDQAAWPPARDVPVAPEPPQRTPAGAYLPPSAVLPSGESLAVSRTNGTADAGEDAPDVAKPSLAERLALGEGDGPLGLPATTPGRTIAVGATIAAFGFFLPWAQIVIGSRTMGGFLDQWGLAGPSHPLVLLMLVSVGALAVAHEKTPIRIGTGAAAIALGSLLLGLAFPYVMGPFQEAVGVYVAAAGAIVMIAGGVLARAPRRHEGASTTV